MKAKIKFQFALAFAALYCHADFAQAQRKDDCDMTLKNMATIELAERYAAPVQHVQVVRYERISETEAMGSNIRKSSATLRLHGTSYYFLMQGTLDSKNVRCKYISVVVSNGDPKDVDEAARQAEEFKIVIGDVPYTSEGDMPWEIAYTKASVGPEFSKAEVSNALGYRGDIAIYGNSETLATLESYIKSEDRIESAAYQALKDILVKQLGELRLIRAQTNSGELNIFLVGRRSDGRLVGLRSISIETN